MNSEWQQVNAARKVLGLPETCSFFEVKSAYRRLVKQYHPDHHPHDQNGDHLQKITLAYQIMERYWEHLPIPLSPEKTSRSLTYVKTQARHWFQTILAKR